MKCAKNECNHETGLNGEDDCDYLCRCHSDILSWRYSEKLDCDAIVSIPRILAEKLKADLYNLMCHYKYNPQGSDYFCCFCHRYAATNATAIVHENECLGVKLEKILTERLG